MTLQGLRIDSYAAETAKSQMLELFCDTKTGIADPRLRTSAQGYRRHWATVLTEDVPAQSWTREITTVSSAIGHKTRVPLKRFIAQDDEEEVFWPVDENEVFAARRFKRRPKLRCAGGKGRRKGKGRRRGHFGPPEKVLLTPLKMTTTAPPFTEEAKKERKESVVKKAKPNLLKGKGKGKVRENLRTAASPSSWRLASAGRCCCRNDSFPGGLELDRRPLVVSLGTRSRVSCEARALEESPKRQDK